MNTMNDKTNFVQGLINAASPGDTIVLPPGNYGVAIYIDKSLALVSDGNATKTSLSGLVDGGSVIVIMEDNLDVVIENITITGGADLRGGGIALQGNSKLTIMGCTISGNSATYHGGGGIYVKNGKLVVVRSRILQNTAVLGGGVLLENQARAIFRSSLVAENAARTGGGGICLKETTFAEILHCTLAENRTKDGVGDNLYLWSSLTSRPSTRIMNSVVAERENGKSITLSECGGDISIFNSFLTSDPSKDFAVQNAEGNMYAPIIFGHSASEKYKLTSDSPGNNLGSIQFLDEKDLDLVGAEWSCDTGQGVTVGAFASCDLVNDL